MLALNRIFLLVLMDLDRREGSASVTVQADQGKRVVHVARGHLVGADSNIRSERLGDMLVGEGLLDPVLLEPVAVEASRQGTLLGSQLVTDGLLSAADLISALDRQVSFRMASALSMRGQVTVDAPRALQPSMQVPVMGAVVTAFRTWVPLAAIEDFLGWPAEEGERRLLNPAPVLARLELGPAESRLTQRLANGEKLDAIVASGAPREPVLRLAGALQAVGLLG